MACIATTSFFTALLNLFFNRKEASWKEFVISFISIVGVLLIFSLDVRYRLGIALIITSVAIQTIRVKRRT